MVKGNNSLQRVKMTMKKYYLEQEKIRERLIANCETRDKPKIRSDQNNIRKFASNVLTS